MSRQALQELLQTDRRLPEYSPKKLLRLRDPKTSASLVAKVHPLKIGQPTTGLPTIVAESCDSPKRSLGDSK
eukprot:1178893-Prorocentrum_minimum.AAC.6